MSRTLINHSPDLQRLIADGYEIEIVGGHVAMRGVPYVNSSGKVRRGSLVSELTLSGDKTAKPSTHVVMFAGEYPCDHKGRPIEKIRNASTRKDLGDGLVIDHTFSSKPGTGAYADYFEKMTAYAAILSGFAEAVDPNATARTFRVIECEDPDLPFHYYDTASSRAGIGALSNKLECRRVDIIGLGGTGAYVLDFVSKTPVREIHIHDGDYFLQHNAFRAPGAASLADLRRTLPKVDYFKDMYGRMHKNIIAYDDYVTAENIERLDGTEFAFVCIDGGPSKKIILDRLEEINAPFIDTGMGLELGDDGLIGALRVTTSTPTMRAHVKEKNRIPYGAGEGADIYAANIQIADLNALNAALALIKWKKLCGFYKDLEGEHWTSFAIDGNHLLNEDFE